MKRIPCDVRARFRVLSQHIIFGSHERLLLMISPLEGTSDVRGKAPTCTCRFKTWNIYGIVGVFCLSGYICMGAGSFFVSANRRLL